MSKKKFVLALRNLSGLGVLCNHLVNNSCIAHAFRTSVAVKDMLRPQTRKPPFGSFRLAAFPSRRSVHSGSLPESC